MPPHSLVINAKVPNQPPHILECVWREENIIDERCCHETCIPCVYTYVYLIYVYTSSFTYEKACKEPSKAAAAAAACAHTRSVLVAHGGEGIPYTYVYMYIFHMQSWQYARTVGEHWITAQHIQRRDGAMKISQRTRRRLIHKKDQEQSSKWGNNDVVKMFAT